MKKRKEKDRRREGNEILIRRQQKRGEKIPWIARF